MSSCQPPEYYTIVQELWKVAIATYFAATLNKISSLQDFASLYEVIKAKHPPYNSKRIHKMVSKYQQIASYISPSLNFIGSRFDRYFFSLDTKCDGYQASNVTPYMHTLVQHVPEFIEEHGNIQHFSCQGKLWLYDLVQYLVAI